MVATNPPATGLPGLLALSGTSDKGPPKTKAVVRRELISSTAFHDARCLRAASSIQAESNHQFATLLEAYGDFAQATRSEPEAPPRSEEAATNLGADVAARQASWPSELRTSLASLEGSSTILPLTRLINQLESAATERADLYLETAGHLPTELLEKVLDQLPLELNAAAAGDSRLQSIHAAIGPVLARQRRAGMNELFMNEHERLHTPMYGRSVLAPSSEAAHRRARAHAEFGPGMAGLLLECLDRKMNRPGPDIA